MAEKIVEECCEKMGYQSLKEEQKQAVLSFIQERDVFVILPTGFGKSLCYGCLPGIFDSIKTKKGSIVVVISPLIALMKDQVEGFVSKGVSAVRAGDCSPDMSQKIADGEYQLIFISPEAILSRRKWRKMLLSAVYQENLVALVIDEAHCVKKWGEDFRLEYSYLRELRSLIPATVNVMALTATASDTLISHVITNTGMIDPVIIQVSPNKENLHYGNQEITSIQEFMSLVWSLKSERTSFKRTIIYCQRQIDCGQLFRLFKSELGPELSDPVGAPYSLPQYRMVDCFSKGTEDLVKDTVLQNCTQANSVLRLIICTAAFGMGINCIGVSRVIHWGPPNDVETYIQQTGRSGRLGEVSYCIMLYGNGLMRHCERQMVNYCRNVSCCRRSVLFNDFKMFVNTGRKCNCCDVCSIDCKCIQCFDLLQNLKLL